MKKAIAIVLTIALFVFGTSLIGVSASSEDLPDAHLPIITG